MSDKRHIGRAVTNATDLNGGVKVEVADFHRKLQVDDNLDWKTSLENYFQIKAYSRKLIGFICKALILRQLRFNSVRVEKQRAQQSNYHPHNSPA